MVAGDRGGNGEGGGDDGTKHRRTDHGERDLSDCQCDGAGHDANKQRAQDASAAVDAAMPAVSPIKNGRA